MHNVEKTEDRPKYFVVSYFAFFSEYYICWVLFGVQLL